MKVDLDTNVLAYAEGANGASMRDKTLELIQRLPPGANVLAVQTLGELFPSTWILPYRRATRCHRLRIA